MKTNKLKVKNLKELEEQLKKHKIPVSKAWNIVFDKEINKKTTFPKRNTRYKEWRFLQYAAQRLTDYKTTSRSDEVRKYMKFIEETEIASEKPDTIEKFGNARIGEIAFRNEKSKKSFVKVGFVRDLNKYKLFPLPTVKQTCARIVRAPFFKDYYKKYFYPNKQFDEYLEINRFYKVVCREIRKSKYDQSFYIKNAGQKFLNSKILWDIFKIIR